MAQPINLADFVPISVSLAELKEQGHGDHTPDATTVRHWVRFRKVRALKNGAGHLLVSREDMHRMVVPTPHNF